MGTVTNVPQAPLAWSIQRASREFAVSVPTLVLKLNQAGEVADEAKLFSTRSIVAALYGEVHRERLAKLKVEREQVELENQVLRGESLPREELRELFDSLARAMVNIIRSSKLTPQEQADLQRLLSNIPIQVKRIASNQPRRRDVVGAGSGNGDKPEGQVRRQRGRRPKKQAAEAEQPADG